MLETLWTDLRYAARMMRRHPGFTIAATLSLAIGIGANAAIFAVTDSLILRTLPVSRPSELFFLNRAGFEEQNLRFSHPMLLRFREQVPGVGVAAMASVGRMQATIDGPAEIILGQPVSGNWFDVAGVSAAEGRLLAAADSQTVGTAPVVVLSHDYWVRRFRADRSIVGNVLRLNGLPLTVVGVAPSGFRGLIVGQRIDVWVPLTMQHELRYYGNASMSDAVPRQPWIPQEGIEWLTLIARVPAAFGLPAATERLGAVRRQTLERQAADIEEPARRERVLRERLELLPGSRGLSPLRATFTTPLQLLMVTVAIVLLIGCANLAALLLARGAARGRELALRLSLGARRSRLIRQLLTESLLLASLGGFAGLVVARWGSQALLRLASSTSTAIPLDVAIDWRLMAFTLAVTIATGIVFGLFPALRLSRSDLAGVMKAAGQAAATDRIGKVSLGKALVVLQIGLSLPLLVGAVLFLRTFENLLDVDTGFERERIVTARFDPRLAQIDESRLPVLYDRLLAEARALPGATGATLAFSGLAGAQRISGFVIAGEPPRDTDRPAREDYVEPGYFTVLGMPILRGRDFAPHDHASAPDVVIVNESLARRFFGDADPIGRKIGYSEPADMEIVGIVRDAKVDGLRQAPPAIVYHSLRQHLSEVASSLYVRAAGPVEVVRQGVTRAVAAAEPNLAVREVLTLDELSARSVINERMISRLTGIFGLLAVVVACLGLYATVSYSVARRTNEIGLRLALGAAPSAVRRLVLRETTLLVIAGSAIGVLLGRLVMSYTSSLLYGLSPHDPATVAGSAVALAMLGVLAGFIPAWRASRVDPLVALRRD